MLASNPWMVLAAPAGLAVDFLCHVIAAVATGGNRQTLAILFGMAAGAVTMLALSIAAIAQAATSATEAAAFLGFNLVIYLGLAYCYCNFVNLNMTSLRIRLLQELLVSPGGLSRAAILEHYNARELVERRIDRLTRQEHLVQRAERFYCRRSVLVPIARTIDFLKWLILGRRNRLLQAAEQQRAAQAFERA